MSGAAQVKGDYRQTQAISQHGQFGLPGGPDVGYGFENGDVSAIDSAQTSSRGDMGNAIGQAMISQNQSADDYAAYHYGRRRSDPSRSSDGSNTLASSGNGYDFALQPKIDEEPDSIRPIDSLSPHGLTYGEYDSRANSPASRPGAPLLSDRTPSNEGGYFSVPPPRGASPGMNNPFSTPNESGMLTPGHAISHGMERAEGYAHPHQQQHQQSFQPVHPVPAQRPQQPRNRTSQSNLRAPPGSRRGSYVAPRGYPQAPVAGAGAPRGSTYRPITGASGGPVRPADQAKKEETVDFDMQML